MYVRGYSKTRSYYETEIPITEVKVNTVIKSPLEDINAERMVLVISGNCNSTEIDINCSYYCFKKVSWRIFKESGIDSRI